MAATTPFFKPFGPLLFGRPARKAAHQLLRRAASLEDLYDFFGHLFSDKLLEGEEKGTNSRERLFSPKTTFRAFVSQVLSPGSPCREAVRRVEAWWRHAQGETSAGMSPSTSAYCQARARLDLQTLELISGQLAWNLQRSEWNRGQSTKLDKRSVARKHRGVARSVRLEYEGALYHVMARGNRREAIFRDDDDRRAFLRGLGEACGRTGWRVHAWVLMDNHDHLFIETPAPNLVAGMKWLQNAYTRRFNARHRQWGRVFGDRYKAIPTEGRQGEYYVALADYIHLNAVRAGLVKPGAGQDLLAYPWSSLAAGYAVAAKRRAQWLAVEAGLAVLGCADTATGRRWYMERLEKRAREESRGTVGFAPGPADGRRSHLRRGWHWGSQAFAEKLLKMLGRQEEKAAANRTYRSGPSYQAHGEARAEKLLTQGLRRAGLKADELAKLAGNDARKVTLALELWEETTVSQGWIAERLEMKSPANVS